MLESQDPVAVGPRAMRTLRMLVGLSVAFAFAAAAWAVRPIEAGPVGFDTAASVLYAQQIASGVHLEVPVSTTPKPLLTLVDGLLYAVTGDWRAISWLAIAVEALAVGLTAALAGRLGGPVAAGFVAGALIGLPELLADVGRASAMSFGLACWAAAGLAMTGHRPRYALAGLLLASGTTARLETVLIAGAGVAAGFILLVGYGLWSPRSSKTGDRQSVVQPAVFAGLGALGGLAIMAGHDLLLTGDPAYWLSVPVRATGSLAVAPPPHWLLVVGRELAALGIAAPLALVGLGTAAWRRGPGVLMGALGLGLGSVALMTGLAARGIWVSARYADPILLVVLLFAGLGAASLEFRARALLEPVAGGYRRLPAGARIAVAFGLGALVAVAGSPTFAPLDRPTRAAIVRDRTVAAHLDRAAPVIERAVAGLPAAREPTRSSIAEPVWQPVVLVTGRLLGPRTIVELGLPASRVGGLGANPRPGMLQPGQVVYHDRAAVADPSEYRWLEVTVPTRIGDVWAEPLLADPSAGIWVVRCSAAPPS